MQPLAVEFYDARLQVGRVLSGWPLVVANGLRAVLVALASVGFTEGGLAAPSWVVLTRLDTGAEVGRLAAGREPGAGEQLLASVRSSLERLPQEDFLRQWSLTER